MNASLQSSTNRSVQEEEQESTLPDFAWLHFSDEIMEAIHTD